MLKVSYSAVSDFRVCEQQYYYRYVQNLRRKDKAPQLQMGSMLHHYIETYYTGLMREQSPQASHQKAIASVEVEYKAELTSYIETAFAVGDNELAKEFQGMLGRATRISERYYRTRGRADADKYTVLFCEHRVRTILSPSIVSRATIDLITRDKQTNQVFLWEHKSGQNIPSRDRRLRDLQTTLYASMARQELDLEIDGIRWNYLRTKEPTIPDMLKSGSLTRRELDTTWDTYAQVIAAEGLQEDDYADLKSKYANKEEDIFFPRFEHLLLQDESVLLGDFVKSARNIQRQRWEWETGNDQPTRSVGFMCDFCDYRWICKTVILGGDEDNIITLRYTKQEEKTSDNAITGTATGTDPVDDLPFYRVLE